MPAFVKSPKGGAPEEINDDLIEKICQTMRAGAYIETAAVVSGVPKTTLYSWLRKAHKEPGSIYERLLHSVEKAMEECVVRDLLNIDKCAMGREPEYERYPKGATDSKGNNIEGNLVFNAKGNPIIKRMSMAPDWSASAWRLERRHPKRWSKQETINNKGKIDIGPQVIVTLPDNGRSAKKKDEPK